MNIYLKILSGCILLLCTLSCKNKEAKDLYSKNHIGVFIDNSQRDDLDPDKRKRYLDSAYAALQDKPNDSTTRFLYRRLTAGYYNQQFYKEAISSSKKTYTLSAEAKDSLTMARALYSSADIYYSVPNKDSAFYFYSQAEKMFSNVNNLGLLGEVLLYKSYIYYDIGEYDLCESEAFKALKLLQNEDKVQDVYNCYNLIATALEGQDNNTEAIKYYQYALNQIGKFKNEGYSDDDIATYRSSCFNNMGGAYVKLGDYKKAIAIYNEALLNPNLETENPELYAKLVNNLAYAKFRSGEHSNLPGLFFKALQVRDQLNDQSGVVASHLYLGEYFAAEKDTAKALGYLKSAYDKAITIKSHVEVLNASKLLSEIDKKNSSFYSAKYFEVNEELQDAAKKAKDKFARIAYETDRLEFEKEELVRKNSFIIGLSAVILLFVAAIFIIYYLNSRNKKLLLIQQQQRANEEIYQLMFEQQSKIESARQDEKNRIAMELHDGILNNIYAVRLNLEFINKKADEDAILKRKEYIKELQKVETEIRGVSHDLSRNAIFHGDKSFKTLLEFMINSQKNNFDTLFDLEIDPDIEWESMSNVIKVNVYRIIQEALQNINKYSKARHAHVEVKKEGNSISVSVTDDGIGFNPDKVKGGIGLKNLRKRALSLNGNLTIESTPGNGSAIKVLFST